MEPMTSASPPTSSRAATLLRWSMAGLAVPPLVILPHELGHYLVLLAVDVPNLAMHYGSVSWDSREFWEAVRREDYGTAAGIAPIGGVALSLAAGPLVSYAMVAGCCYGCARWRPHAVLVAVGYGCPLRVLVGVQHGVIVLLGGDPPASYDELALAALTGIPVQAFVGFGVARPAAPMLGGGRCCACVILWGGSTSGGA